MEIWISTGNKGKLNEYKSILKETFPGKIFSIADVPSFSPRPEDGKTFMENAHIKARSLAALKQDTWVLGEDSGLEVTGLDNLPGIYTARYAGPKASDNENMAKLLKMLQIRQVVDRSAQFVCALVAIGPKGEVWEFVGNLKGQIAKKPSGQLGFGYDPIFIPDNESQTLAELGPGYKLMKTHRAEAARQFLEKLKNH